jgi:hypothetical protein
VTGFAVRAVLALVASLLLGSGLAYVAHQQRDIGRAEIQSQWDAAKAKANADALIQTQQWAANQKEIQRVTSLSRTLADDDARAAAAVSLRHIAADFAARSAASRPAPEPGIAPAAPPEVVLADVLGGVDEAAGELAHSLDLAYVAGVSCEHEYSSATSRLQPQPGSGH